MAEPTNGFDACFTPFCGLCVFPFQDGQSVVTVEAQDDTSDDGRSTGSSDTASNQSNQNSQADDTGESPTSLREAVYRPCNCLCTHVFGTRYSFHKDCYAYAGHEFHSINRATSCSFDDEHYHIPEPRTSAIMSTATLQMLPTPCSNLHKLSWDILLQIADYLVRSYSIANILATQAKPDVFNVDLNHPVWAQFVKFHGSLYVSRLVNNPKSNREANRQSFLLYTPCIHRPIQYIHIGYDNWGVRKIIFGNSTIIPSTIAETNVWWETLPPSCDGTIQSSISCQTDGMKLRAINFSELPHRTAPTRYLWTTPLLSSQPPTALILTKQPQIVKMTPIAINSSEAMRYQIGIRKDMECFQGFNNTQTPSTHAYYGSRGRWLYISLKSNEWIREIWIRRYSGLGEQVALILVTNTGQAYILGEFPRPGYESLYIYSRIAILPEEPTMLFVGLHSGLHTIALDALVSETKTLQCPFLPKPCSPYPTTSDQAFFFSCADLTGLAEIRPCRVSSIITGVLLLFENDTEVALGWVSYSQLEPAERVQSGMIWFLIEHVPWLSDKLGFPHVTQVQVSKPVANAHAYFLVTCTNKLEWWFSSRQCQLSFNGKQTQAVRL